jgi:hypothetical protein
MQSLYSFYTVQSRFSPVPINTLLACRHLYTAELFGTAFRGLVPSSAFVVDVAQLGSLLFPLGLSMSMRQYSFYITTHKFVCLILQAFHNASTQKSLSTLVADYGAALSLLRQDISSKFFLARSLKIFV